MAEPPPPDLSLLSDQQLLELFSGKRDPEAFRQLVVRHAPLVLATCRRGLCSPADADDAFQATFLVLARSAGKIRRRQALGAWLYGVATRVCLRMRRDAARRSTQELLDAAGEPMDPLDELLARHDATVVDEELRGLPASLRDPLVLRYLAGKSNAEVATELGLTLPSLEGRLKRGKQQLRRRLIRRGVSLVVLVATLKATRVTAGEVPPALVDSAVALGTGSLSAETVTTNSTTSSSTTTSTTQIALQELSAMNTLFAMKPAAALLSVCGIAAALLVASQVGPSPLSSAHAGEEGGIELMVIAAGEELAEEKVDVEVELQNSDASPASRTGFDPAGEYGRGGDARGVDGFGGEGERGGYGTGVEPGDAVGLNRGAPGNSGLYSEGGLTPDYGTVSSKDIPHIVDLKSRSKMEVFIELALKSPLSEKGLNFVETPLSEVVEFLREECKLGIQLDVRALEDIGLSPDDTVTCNLKNIRLDSALDLMLSQHGLTYIIRDEVLLITSEDEASNTYETRAYPADVILGQNAEELVKVITTTVAPDTWMESGGGEGAIAHISDRLVIYQTYAVHREINELLSQLRTVNESPQ